ncbi:MAG: hypothetical protein K2K50_02745, partial [Anaeroplasmataceae bacterium]|nr:hypothetical protein [Anaeroplasmataceae bacterium]
LVSIAYGIFYSLTQLLTFSFKNSYNFSDLTLMDFYMFLFGTGFSLTGLGTGFLFQILYKKKKK